MASCLLLTLAALASSGQAHADDAREFELAQNRFDTAEYEEAAKRFAVLLDPTKPPCSNETAAGACRLTDPDLIERARGSYATSLVALKRPLQADEQILAILKNNANYVPSPAVFPREVIDRFTEVRSKHKDEIADAQNKKLEEQRKKLLAAQQARDAEKEYQQTIERLAANETIRESNSRWIAAIPFGVGQFQNRDHGLGWFFFASQVLSGGLSITAAAIAYDRASIDPYDPSLEDAEGRVCGQQCRDELASQRDTWITVNRLSFGAWAVLTTAGIVQAQIAYVPERVTYRPRQLPKRPPPAPTVSVVPGLGGVAVRGTF